MNFWDVWDTRNVLTRLQDVTTLLAVLTSPGSLKTDDIDVFHGTFCDIAERLGECLHQLDQAIESAKFNDQQTTQANA